MEQIERNNNYNGFDIFSYLKKFSSMIIVDLKTSNNSITSENMIEYLELINSKAKKYSRCLFIIFSSSEDYEKEIKVKDNLLNYSKSNEFYFLLGTVFGLIGSGSGTSDIEIKEINYFTKESKLNFLQNSVNVKNNIDCIFKENNSSMVLNIYRIDCLKVNLEVIFTEEERRENKKKLALLFDTKNMKTTSTTTPVKTINKAITVEKKNQSINLNLKQISPNLIDFVTENHEKNISLISDISKMNYNSFNLTEKEFKLKLFEMTIKESNLFLLVLFDFLFEKHDKQVKSPQLNIQVTKEHLEMYCDLIKNNELFCNYVAVLVKKILGSFDITKLNQLPANLKTLKNYIKNIAINNSDYVILEKNLLIDKLSLEVVLIEGVIYEFVSLSLIKLENNKIKYDFKKIEAKKNLIN